MNTMWLTDSNHGSLMTNSEREMGKTARNPEATKVSDEEYQEANCTSVVGSKPQGMQSTPQFCKRNGRWLF